jgi:hypothetical protein
MSAELISGNVLFPRQMLKKTPYSSTLFSAVFRERDVTQFTFILLNRSKNLLPVLVGWPRR